VSAPGASDVSPVAWQATALAESDNVAVALRPIGAGERVVVRTPRGAREVVAREAIPLCHKIALADIASGEPLVKYGACIGEATAAIACGAWVHTHNVVSRRGRKVR
jgi:hypothetical protein